VNSLVWVIFGTIEAFDTIVWYGFPFDSSVIQFSQTIALLWGDPPWVVPLILRFIVVGYSVIVIVLFPSVGLVVQALSAIHLFGSFGVGVSRPDGQWSGGPTPIVR